MFCDLAINQSRNGEKLFLVERRSRVLVRGVKKDSGVVFVEPVSITVVVRQVLLYTYVDFTISVKDVDRRKDSEVVLVEITGVKMVVREVPSEPKKIIRGVLRRTEIRNG